MVRLRSRLACIYVFALFAIAATAAAQTSGPTWELITAPADGGTTSQSNIPPYPYSTRHVYILNGEAGVADSPLPGTIKEDLLPSPDPGASGTVTLDEEEGGEVAYIVSQEISEGIAASELAGQLTPEIASIAEPEDEETSSSFSSSSVVVGNSIFGGSCATKEYLTAKQVDLGAQEPFTDTFELGGGATGTLTLEGDLEGTVNAVIKFGVKRKNIFGFCIPYGVKVRNIHIYGNAASTGGVHLQGTVHYTGSFGPYQIAKPLLFTYPIRLYYVTINVGAHLPITTGMQVTATAVGDLNYNGEHTVSGTFDYNCTLDNCVGTSNFDNSSPGNQTVTANVNGRVKPTVYLDIGVRGWVYSDNLISAQVGLRANFVGDLWGYAGNTCGDADGNGTPETVDALTFDLDRRTDVTGRASILGASWSRTLKTGTPVHMSFWDLGGSTAMQPQLHGPASVEIRDPATYKVKIRPCWPYTDPVTYRLNWGDGSAVQELQGAPATELTASHTWNTGGSKTVTATSWRDGHGRLLDQPYSRTVEVTVPPGLTLTVPPRNPATAPYGTPINWTATATGGHTASTQYALFRRRPGATDWIPAVTAPSWQTSNVLSWTPDPADAGVWEIIVWVKDRNTPPDANTYGFAAYTHAGNVQVVAPLTVSCSAPNPATVTYGNPVTWTATTAGGTPGTIQFLLSRQRAGTSTWISTPWQTSNAFGWTPSAADVGTWQVWITVKDVNTPADPGHTASCNGGQPKVVAPLSLSVTPSPSQSGSGNPINWTATASGGDPASIRYALFRRRAGATDWIPPVTAPAWQASNALSWTPGTADAGTWEIIVWVKDGYTPATMNTHGFAAYANAGPVEVKAPLAVTVPPAPAYVTYGNPVTVTATATGGDTATIQYTLGRRRVGQTAWIPDPLVWQSGNVLSWTPASADVGSWEIAVGVRDRNTPAGANGLGYSASAVAGTVQVVAPLSLTATVSPAQVVYGNPVTWTATASGGVPATTRFAFFRRRSGTTPWTPDATAPNWQTSNTFTWTPTSADVGTWDTYVWVKDGNTPATMNTYGYAAGANTGPVKVLTQPLTLTGTSSPQYATSGNAITWTATAGGGTPSTTRYALFRRRAGTTPWTPDVTAPAWQTGNVLSWTPAAADTGTWEIIVWVKDGDTPATMNTHGYAAYYNAGPVQVVAPLGLTVTPSPESRPHNDTRLITWTATASGGIPSTYQYAFFRRRAGATAWTPAVTAPAWQTSNSSSWDPGPADVGTWETYVWVKDSATTASQNTYGYAAGYNSGPVVITAPLCLSSTASPAYVTTGTAATWTATPCGGYPPTTQLALFRRRAGATAWIPDVTAPAWQSGNVFTWTPATTDVGTWEVLLWVRDDDTPPSPGYGATYNPGNVQVVAPLSLSATVSPGQVVYGNPVTWTATASGGVPATTKYAFFRRRSGNTAWIPDASAPVWQTSNTFTWTPASADVGTWDTYVWVKDGNTPATMNTYGYAAGANTGPVKVVTPPLTLTGTGSPSTSTYGNPITWTATAGGGTPSTTRYALFRRRAGTTPWTPDVTAPAWQTGNVLSWTPASGDTGTWEIIVWVKDGDTPATMNTYGYAAYYNAGPVQVVAPLSLSLSGTPSVVNYGTTITWTANANGGTPSSIRYAFFRRRAGASTWIPDANAPAWQTSNTFSWTPASADAGTWDIYAWVKDGNTPATMNTYGYAAGANGGQVRVVAPLSGLNCSGNPSAGYTGTNFTWSANNSGGDSATLRYALLRRRVGSSTWIPAQSSPSWQSSNVFNWTTSGSDTGTWEISIWVKDGNTPANANTYGYAVSCSPGTIQVLTPPTVTGTTSPSTSPYGATISWTATASGGDASSMRYAIFRRRAGTSSWTPDVTTPSWQSGRTFSWTPTSADTGTWEVFIWVKDAYTPSNMNTYGHAAWYNAGNVEVTTPAPLTVSGTGSPSTSPWGTSISWTANTSGGVPSTVKYALFRRKAGTSNWIPDLTAPSWQTSNVLRWTPSSADVGTWEVFIWVKDINTPPNMNTYGHAAWYNAGAVQVY